MSDKGFGLIEIVVTIALIGILAAIAYPSYQDSIRKSRRADAHAAIQTVQLAQERLRGNCRFYAQTLSGATGADTCGATAALSSVRAAATSPDSYYNISITANSATGNAYTVEADPTGKQAGDTSCDPITLTINNANPHGLKGPAGCW